MCSVVVVAAAAQLFWKPAELNVGPCISLTLTLHGCCLTLMICLSEGKITSVIRINHLRKVKASCLSSFKLLLQSQRAQQFSNQGHKMMRFPRHYISVSGISGQIRPEISLKRTRLLADGELFSGPCLPRPKLKTFDLYCPTM